MTNDNSTPWMTRQEVAPYARTTVGHLANLASRGEGPRARGRNGNRPLYHRDDVDAWILGQESAR